MIVNGKNIQFKRTMWSQRQLIEMSPDKDIKRLGEVFEKPLAETIETQVAFIIMLNKSFNMWAEHNHIEHDAPITEEDIYNMECDDFDRLLMEAISSLNGKQRISAKPTSKNA